MKTEKLLKSLLKTVKKKNIDRLTEKLPALTEIRDEADAHSILQTVLEKALAQGWAEGIDILTTNLASFSSETVTCECCYEEAVDVSKVVRCTKEGAAHSFCYACIQKFVGEKLFQSQQMQFTCFSPEGCTAFLEQATLIDALPASQQNLLHERRWEAEVLSAFEKENKKTKLFYCPFCTKLAGYGKEKALKVLRCPRSYCGKVSCLSCEQQEHPDQSCQEARQLNLRGAPQHRIAEARTNAVVTECPRCHLQVRKDGGCNHMTCINIVKGKPCDTDFCNVCKNPIPKHQITEHYDPRFGGQCPQYDEQDEETKINEAGARAALEIAGAPLDPYQNFPAREPITQNEAFSLGYDGGEVPYEPEATIWPFDNRETPPGEPIVSDVSDWLRFSSRNTGFFTDHAPEPFDDPIIVEEAFEAVPFTSYSTYRREP